MSLERRFLELLGTLPGAESLDAASVLPIGYQGKRADFSLFGRSLLVEVKSLQEDQTHRVQAIIDEYSGRPGAPLIIGEVPVTKVIAAMPVAWQEEVRRRVVQGVTKAAAKAIEQANRQIRESKLALNAASAGGLLVLLNDEVPILSPNLLVYRIQKHLQIQRPDGSHRFSELNWVMMISKSHLLLAQDGTWAYPMLLIQGPPTPASDRVAEFANYIRTQWAYIEDARQIDSKATQEVLENYRILKPD